MTPYQVKPEMGLGRYCTIETPTAALAAKPIRHGLIRVERSEPLPFLCSQTARKAGLTWQPLPHPSAASLPSPGSASRAQPPPLPVGKPALRPPLAPPHPPTPSPLVERAGVRPADARPPSLPRLSLHPRHRRGRRASRSPSPASSLISPG